MITFIPLIRYVLNENLIRPAVVQKTRPLKFKNYVHTLCISLYLFYIWVVYIYAVQLPTFDYTYMNKSNVKQTNQFSYSFIIIHIYNVMS